jgi:hypothetical protein
MLTKTPGRRLFSWLWFGLPLLGFVSGFISFLVWTDSVLLAVGGGLGGFNIAVLAVTSLKRVLNHTK